jgi:hypothetical protein
MTAPRKPSITLSHAQNTELRGLEVHLDRPWWDDLKTREGQGIVNRGHVIEPNEVMG